MGRQSQPYAIERAELTALKIIDIMLPGTRGGCGVMLALSTQSKLLMLFLSEKNQLWRMVLQPEITTAKITACMGISPATYENWMKGHHTSRQFMVKTFSELSERILDPPQKAIQLKGRKWESEIYAHLTQEERNRALTKLFQTELRLAVFIERIQNDTVLTIAQSSDSNFTNYFFVNVGNV